MKTETRQKIAVISNQLDELYKLKELVETSDTIMFTSEGRPTSDMVSLDPGERNNVIIEAAKEATIKQIEERTSALEEELCKIDVS